MVRWTILLLSLVLPFLPAGVPVHSDPPGPVFPVPSPEQLAWHEMEMNAFIHFTVNTFTNLEWGLGNESPAIFNPVKADPVQWVTVLQNTGFKGVILTCKHHDGFCLWPSSYTRHSIQYSPYRNGKGDLVKSLSDACRDHGMKFGVYLSPWDRNYAGYGTPSYIQYYRNQLRELFTRYGPIFEMWFDGANGGTGYYGGANEKRTIDGRTYYDWPTTLQMIRKIQPGVLFFSDAGPDIRWVGNEKGIAGETNWNCLTPDTLYAGKPGIEKLLQSGSEDGTCWIPAEADVSIRPGWFYHSLENAQVKTPEQLFNIYLTTVGRGAVLLLNVPPDPDGLFHQDDIRALRGFRALLNREFHTNLAARAPVKASSVRGNDQRYNGAMTTDGNKNTYWSTDDSTCHGSLTVDLGNQDTVKYIMIQEYITLGQRVESFSVEYHQGNQWIRAAQGTTIGYKRILQIQPIVTRQIRINITHARACPVISNIEVF